ncbi:MAG: helix-turn-helix transcriptional regulator [Oscillospiraceae bacterium]|nr:helix-turn-helix transcriptional regulator [Oscillospiraceae bacterium]
MRLKEIRKNRGITQLKFAMDLNISQNTISRYETGEREADYTTLIRLTGYFNVSLDYLLERTDDPTFHKK